MQAFLRMLTEPTVNGFGRSEEIEPFVAQGWKMPPEAFAEPSKESGTSQLVVWLVSFALILSFGEGKDRARIHLRVYFLRPQEARFCLFFTTPTWQHPLLAHLACAGI